MGLTDLFTNATSALVPPPGPAKSEADLDRSKDEIVRRLTEELVHTRQARKNAELRVRELEDVLALKNGMFDSLERQIVLLEKYVADLQHREAELAALRAEQAEQPVSASDVAHRFEQLSDLFTQLQDTLTCPVCYEPFGRGQAVSLQCGHTFCQTCYSEWEQRHVEAFKMSPQQGVYLGPECPECRTADVRRGRVRIYSLEEVVRLVERGKREIAAHPYTPPIEKETLPVTGAELLLQEQHAAAHGCGHEDGDAESAVLTADVPFTDTAQNAADAADGAQLPETGAASNADTACVPVSTPAVDTPPIDLAPENPTRDEVLPLSPEPEMPFDSTLPSPGPADSGNSSASPPAVPSPPPPDLSHSPSVPDASRLSLEETYLRERAAARLRAREEELRFEAEMAARRAEEEEREAREAREQLLVERGRRPYAVEGSIRDTV
ncbi:hypothetical protein JCM3774_000386 [Rhodotorula dairenensis]